MPSLSAPAALFSLPPPAPRHFRRRWSYAFGHRRLNPSSYRRRRSFYASLFAARSVTLFAAAAFVAARAAMPP